MVPALGELLRDRQPDAAARSGYQRDWLCHLRLVV
jgi:hypothetical protein